MDRPCLLSILSIHSNSTDLRNIEESYGLDVCTNIIQTLFSVKDDIVWDLLTKLLAFDRHKRISASDALKHEFFTGEQALKEVSDEAKRIALESYVLQQNGDMSITIYDTQANFILTQTEVKEYIDIDPEAEYKQIQQIISLIPQKKKHSAKSLLKKTPSPSPSPDKEIIQQQQLIQSQSSSSQQQSLLLPPPPSSPSQQQQQKNSSPEPKCELTLYEPIGSSSVTEKAEEDIGEYSVVIDNGSGTIKVGYSGDEQPQNMFPSVVGKLNKEFVKVKPKSRDYYIGSDILRRPSVMELRNPIERGIINNWDDMEKIWHYSFHKILHTEPDQHPLLVSETPLNSKQNRQILAQILFEKFSVKQLYIKNTGVLSLLGTGRKTGLVLESGDGVTCAVPIQSTITLAQSIIRMDYAGQEITDYLRRILGELGLQFQTSRERDIVRDIKEKLCYVALDYDAEMKKEPEQINKSFEMPDGQMITINNQLFRSTETLFQSNLIGLNLPGIHQMVFQSVMQSKEKYHKDLFQNVILSGGSTIFRGIEERLNKEFRLLSPETEIKVSAPPNRDKLAWLGGSVLASQSIFQQLCISKAEYDEKGPDVIYNKCQ